MICKKCGKEIDDNSEFCPFCGKEVVLHNDANNNLQKKDETGNNAGIHIIIGIFLIFIVIIECSIYSDYDNSFLNNSNNINALFSFLGIIILIIAIVFCKKIKDVVLKIARWSLDFSTTLDALMGVIILIAGIFVCSESSGMISYWWFVLGALLYTLIALVKDYALYLLIDIRDSLKILSDKAKEEEKESIETK